MLQHRKYFPGSNRVNQQAGYVGRVYYFRDFPQPFSPADALSLSLFMFIYAIWQCSSQIENVM
jgi:hypothetical protein